MGMLRVKGAVSRAVAVFNEGATEAMSLMNRLHIDITSTTETMLAKRDEKRRKSADKASTNDSRKKRKEYVVKRKINQRKEDQRDGDVYEAGGH